MLLESALGSGSQFGRSLFFECPVRWIKVTSLQELPEAFRAIEQAIREGFWVAGYLAYECGYHWEPAAAPAFTADPDLPLAMLGVYQRPEDVENSGLTANTCGLAELELSLSPVQFAEKFERVQRYIDTGDTYQVNLTCTVETEYSQSPDLLFAHMMARQPVPFGAMLHVGEELILSASPELFFSLQNRSICVKPMKGTARRDPDPQKDDLLARELAGDEKNRAENVMIVDLLRNDLGRIAKTGTVRVSHLFEVERHPSLLQMTSTVEAELRQEVSLYELFRAIFPSGSIVGAPKVRTMQIIRTLEKRNRGVYTGAIGYFSPQNDAVFSVAIRTATLRAGHLSMGVGSGITTTSEQQAEYAECSLKTEFLKDNSFRLIESMRWQHGACKLLPLHLERLHASAIHFGFDCDADEVHAKVQEYGADLDPAAAWKLRLELGRDGTCSLSASRLVADPAAALKAIVWPLHVMSGDPWLRHKSTRRALYDDAHRQAVKRGYVDALFCNEHGMLAEGAIHSIFVRHGSRWRTPPLQAGVLPGIARRQLLELHPEIEQVNVPFEELWSADEVWLTNAVRGTRPVTVTPDFTL